MRAERKRLQLARMIDTGAHLRIGGVIHVQKRGRQSTKKTLLSEPQSSENDQTCVPGLEEGQLPVVSQSTPFDGSLEEGRDVGPEGTERVGRIEDTGCGKNKPTVDSKLLKTSVARNTGVHSKEALAERMAQLRSQRWVGHRG